MARPVSPKGVPACALQARFSSVSGRPPGYAGVGASVMLSCQGGESPTDVKS